jgi:hypothetical protein
MSTQEFFAFKITQNLTEQLDAANSFGSEPSEIGKTPKTIRTRNVSQNPDGTWSDNPVELVDSIKTPLELQQIDYDKQERNVDDYKKLAKPYDNQMYDYNVQINSIKQQIITIVNTAVGYGCSTSPSYVPAINPTTGFAIIPKKLPVLKIDNIGVGRGEEIFEDLVKIKRYENMEELRDDNVFEESQNRLTPARFGNGFENTIENNDGDSLGVYKIINPYTVGFAGTVPILISSPTCAGYASSISQVVQGIPNLRKLREKYLSVVNVIKEDKTQEEIQIWGDKDIKKALDSRKKKLKKSISNLSTFVDPIVIDKLVIYSDADKTYGISTSIENTTGINQVLSLSNLSDDGVYATAPANSPTFDRSDGSSIWFNQYGSTNKYLEFNKSYIDGDGSGISSGDVSYSLEAWFKITDDTNLTSNIDTGGASIIGISSTRGIGLQVYKPSGIRVNSGSRGNGSLENTSNLSINTWYHVAFVREVGKDNKIYINGIMENSSNISDLSVLSSSASMRIGFCTSTYIRQYFPGKISAVRFYSKALSNTEVKQNYEAHVDRFV